METDLNALMSGLERRASGQARVQVPLCPRQPDAHRFASSSYELVGEKEQLRVVRDGAQACPGESVLRDRAQACPGESVLRDRAQACPATKPHTVAVLVETGESVHDDDDMPGWTPARVLGRTAPV